MDSVTTSGRIEYRTDDVGVEGVEDFRITRFRNGRRVLRATSQMFNDKLLRDTLLVVDASWRPELAQMHLLIDGFTVGAGQYLVDADRVRFEGRNREGNPVSDSANVRVPAFGGHALQNDAWMLAAADRAAGDEADRHLGNVLITSRLPNGADGPALLLSDHHYRYLGAETVETPAGRFATRHFEFLLEDRPSIHYWLHGEDYLLIRCRWDLLRQSYELVELAT